MNRAESSSSADLGSYAGYEFYSWISDPSTTANKCVHLLSYTSKNDITTCNDIETVSGCTSQAICNWNYEKPSIVVNVCTNKQIFLLKESVAECASYGDDSSRCNQNVDCTFNSPFPAPAILSNTAC